MGALILFGCIFAASLAWLLARSRFRGNTRHILPLPPGPKGLPLVGNINDLPPQGSQEYLHWQQFKKRYGSLSSITILGQTMIITHDRNIALELMEKRASKHSGRPNMKFAMEMCGQGELLACQPYGSTHRLHRKYVHQQLGSKAAVSGYDQLQEVAVGRFLWRLMHDEGRNLVQHLYTEAGETILNIVYGYNIEPHGRDALIEQVGEAMEQFSAASVPGKWAVDIVPFLKNLPDWMPGTGFKQTARLWKQTMSDVAEVPYNFAKTRTGEESRISFVSKSIEQAQREDSFGTENEHAIKWSAASMYTGGADTSVSTMAAFFLAMSMFPEVQQKAQEEIDRVVGSGRLPKASDREKLPYVNAVVEEAQRWHPIAPMGLPHAADDEDTIEGFRIPKGALLVPAIWWFTRDPEVYHDPEEFKPERFLPPCSEPPATQVTFGFGRRICPGRVLADASLFLIFAQSLAAFDIHKVRGENGSVVEPVHTFKSGIVSHPGSFEVQVLPRSTQVAGLVDAVVKDHPWVESDAKYIKKAVAKG